MKKLKKIIILCLIVVISFFFAYKISNAIFYDYMFFINMNDSNYKLVNSYNNGVTFPLEKIDDYYLVKVNEEITGEPLTIKIWMDESNKNILNVEYNDNTIPIKRIIEFNDISKYDSEYENMPCFVIGRDNTIRIISIVLIGIINTVLISLIIFKEFNKECGLSIFTYSKSSYKLLNKKCILILFGIFIVTAFITVGCDAKVIANISNLFAKDIDIYQLQVNSKLILGREYAEFPYNSLMLYIWGGILSIFSPITQNLPVIDVFPYFEVAFMKLFNIIFIVLTILSILSFLIDKKFVDIKKAKFIFYLSIFNPVTFYVAILFVQLDALTLYLVVTGILLLNNINNDKYLGILLLSIGLLLKMQILFLLPIIIISILYIIIFEKKEKYVLKIKRIVISGLIFIYFAIIYFVILYIGKMPFYYLESNLAQSERLWYTTIQYSSNTFLYVTLGCMVIAMLIFVFNLHLNIKKENIILSTILYIGTIILLFSFAILPTPSIYIVTLGSFVIYTSLEKDNLKKIIFIGCAILIIICPMFSDYGDISKIITGPNSTGYITKYISSSKENLKINSIMFTISSISMLIYSIYFGKKAISILRKEEM